MRATIMHGPGDVRVEKSPNLRSLNRPMPFIDELLPDVLEGKIEPGRVFDFNCTLESVAEGYRAMDERRAIKTLLRP